ncbi:Vacuolar iron transporter (VIT) family protein [Arabidopsis thaliana]|uniref:Vacuolar iron transporter (VIT) family protein n=1 Tax=Arabidopsis thaliana TaxID=3702 RepID=A0A1P8B475_ARATH|nr:Vacuolar iron transporter (VIT) family protein [Arabidopsis thaliana]ANM66361.1 Vacuolar iron transporter (VIT) family protein [Arabidopsis thaliana]|eukprot:NP_001328259.1 Vacuolar iron transporter (VIT) family protein [Arabidopsis thaliana]
MGSAAELTEPTTGTEKLHQPIEVEEDDEQIVDLERKTFRHGKGHDTSVDSSTITNTSSSSSSSFSGDGGTEETPDFHSNGDGEHTDLVNLEVPELETEIVFHQEHDDGKNCIVFFDGEQGIWKCRHCDWTYKEGSLLCKGSESAGAIPDAHEESQTADLNGEQTQLEPENGSTSEDNERSREIEEVLDGDVSKDLDAVDPLAGEVIEEEVDFEDVEYHDVENMMDKQETHDLYCPNCDSCITKKVILKRRKRKIRRHELGDSKRPHLTEPLFHSEDNLPSLDGGENSANESFVFKCLSCFTIFIPKGVSSKPIPPRQGVEGLKIQPNPQVEATGDSNWFSSIFGLNKKESAIQQGGASSSVLEANPPPRESIVPVVNPSRGNLSPMRKDTTGSAVVQPDAATSIQVAKSNDTSEIVNNGAIVGDGQKFLAPMVEEQTQQKIDNDDSSTADGNHTSDKGRLSPIQPSHGMSILNTVTNGPDGLKVETTIHEEGAPLLFEGKDTPDTSTADFGLTKVTGVMDTGDRGVITGPANPEIDISAGNLLEEGSLREPLMRRVVVQGRKLEILKSIVYGGLLEAITSLGVISSAAGSGASMLNILVLGLANLLGGLILIIHNLQELREEEPIRTTTEDNQTNGREEEEGRYKRLLGRRENFTLHATVAILSFIITGILPPVVYYFSFSEKHNKDYKVASVFGASLFCIVLLAIAKAHVRYPRGSYLKSILYYGSIAVSVSGISYVVGNFLEQLLEKHGWSDGSETPVGQMMLSSLMGRKAGFGYSSSY